MKKYQKIAFIISISLFATIVIAYAIFFFLYNPYPCSSNIQNDAAIECHGVISLDGYGENGFHYSITDDVQRYTIAKIRRFNDFKFINNKIYVIDQARDFGFDNINKQYDKYYFIDGQIKHITSATKESMPKLFVIDTISGNVYPYVSINEVPESEKDIFKGFEE